MDPARPLLAPCFVLLVACSGAGATVPPEEAAPVTPASTASPTEPAPPATAPSVVPPPGDGGPGDPGLVVNDLEEPACHDLPQRGSLVATETKPGAPQPGAPLTTPSSGLYVATELVEWGTETTAEAPTRTTVFVNKAGWYYVSESTKERDVVTTTWSLDAGVLARKVVCRSGGSGLAFEQRIWASPNGFTVLATSRAGRPLSVRYERRD